jgi:hypothetical protein
VKLLSCLPILVAGAMLSAGLPINPSAASAQAPECSVRNAPTLCTRAGLDSASVNYLLLVDESGSMRPLWPAVRSALASFALAVPEGGQLDVRTFAGTVRQRIPATQSTEATRRSWMADLGDLDAPRGQHTDLGRAAEAAVAAIAATPRTETPSFIFILTDGIQEPEPGSPYGPGWGPAWDALANQTARLSRQRPVQVVIVRLASDADPGLLRRVFPQALMADAFSAQALAGFFRQVMAQNAFARLQLMVQHDIQRPAALVERAEPILTFSRRATTVDFELRSQRELVTTRIPAGTSFALPGGGSVVTTSDVVIEPGSAATVNTRVTDRRYRYLAPPNRWTRAIEAPAEFSSVLEPAHEIDHLLLPATVAEDTALVRLALAGGGALPPWLYWPLAALAALVAVLVVRAIIWSLHRPTLPGRVLVRTQTNGTDWDEETVRFKDMKVKEYMVRLRDGRAVLQLLARNERGKTVVDASPAELRVRLDERPLVASTPMPNKITRLQTEGGEITYYPK